jgi:hypothetical protein
MNNNDNRGKRKSKKKTVLRNVNKSEGSDIIKPQIFLDIDQTTISSDCNLLNLQPNFNIPNLEPKEVLNGGNTKNLSLFSPFSFLDILY